MGYAIKDIAEITTFDFSLCAGYSTADTVRKSIDGTKFIVEGDSFTDYTKEEMITICEGPEWTSTEEVI
jgi:hypothetical protein